MSSSEGTGPRAGTTYHQESSRGATFNGDTSGGNHTSTYGRGKNVVSNTHDHSKLKVTTTTISNNYSANVNINAAIILDIIRTVFAFFNLPANRGELVHPIHGEAGSPGRDSSTAGPIHYNMNDSLPHDVDEDGNNSDEVDDPQAAGSTSAQANQPARDDRPDDSDYDLLPLKNLDLASTEGQSATNAEIYARLMMNCGEGLPCWRPRPLAGTRGITPGDVGIFDFIDGFQKLFNIWDAEYGASGQLPHKTIRPIVDHFPEGHTIANGACSDVRRSQSSDKEHFDQFEFTCLNEQGAILALTTSADLENLDDPDLLRVFLTHNAGRLYEQASSMKQRSVESLYIVTGCVKSESWALAAYRDAPACQALRLDKRFSDRNTSTDKGKLYDWKMRPGTGEARLWPNTTAEAASACGEKNHTLFLRGFQLRFSPSFSARFESEKVKSSGEGFESGVGHGTGGFKGSSDGPRSSRGSTSDLQSNLSASSSQARNTNNLSSNDVHINPFPSTGTTPPMHPCDAITSLLLQMTGADCAISHDDDWRHISKNSNTSFLDVFASRRVSVYRGVAHLLTANTDIFLDFTEDQKADDGSPLGPTKVGEDFDESSDVDPVSPMRTPSMPKTLKRYPARLIDKQSSEKPHDAKRGHEPKNVESVGIASSSSSVKTEVNWVTSFTSLAQTRFGNEFKPIIHAWKTDDPDYQWKAEARIISRDGKVQFRCCQCSAQEKKTAKQLAAQATYNLLSTWRPKEELAVWPVQHPQHSQDNTSNGRTV